ncbi:hypothetical protein BDZ94DRAFT_1257454 [Collybia nuda]|uniref:Uncharacterized protein n=1 Tax=Collybia nuda TaxID=64659 RepID=A0A9P6CFF7_9AGAR|nr:hypothetical protein BDZ94DRAFT_1257454 [Collybia nuda]
MNGANLNLNTGKSTTHISVTFSRQDGEEALKLWSGDHTKVKDYSPRKSRVQNEPTYSILANCNCSSQFYSPESRLLSPCNCPTTVLGLSLLPSSVPTLSTLPISPQFHRHQSFINVSTMSQIRVARTQLDWHVPPAVLRFILCRLVCGTLIPP